MKTRLKALAVIAALTLTGTTAQAALRASEVAAKWCNNSTGIGRDGMTCQQAAAVKAQEMIWYEAYERWIIVLGTLPETDNEFKKWRRGKISLALGCAYDAKSSGAVIRSPAQFQSVALATYNRIMARPYSSRWTQNSGDCGW